MEVVLLDTRTSLVSFTTLASRSFDVRENAADLSIRETILKAQLSTVALALSDVSALVADYLYNTQ